MSKSTAEGFIRLFGLFLMVSAIIDVARGIVFYFHGTAMLGAGWITMEEIAKGSTWGLVQLAVTLFSGVIILSKSRTLAGVVVPGGEDEGI